MRRNLKLSALLVVPLAMLAFGWPSVASAQHRGRGASRVVVVGGPYMGGPYFYDPFFDPWFGNQWGYPYPYPPYGGYRMAPADASVRLDVKPRDAQVYVDGYFAGIVDDFDGAFQRLHVLPGQHEITIYKEGYRSVHERLYLSPNSTRKISHDLDRLAAGEPNEPLPQPAAEAPAPQDPPDRGVPPRAGRGPAPRRGPDAAPRQSRSGSTGTVALRVQPDDAEILIDGERWAGGSDEERLVVQLAEGQHRIDVQKDGYRRVTLDVQVRRGETTPVNVSLSPQ